MDIRRRLLRLHPTGAADGEAFEVLADEAEERGDAALARYLARQAGDKFANAAALLVETDATAAIVLVRRAEVCYRRGMNWGKAKLIRTRLAEIEVMIAERSKSISTMTVYVPSMEPCVGR